MCAIVAYQLQFMFGVTCGVLIINVCRVINKRTGPYLGLEAYID